MEEADPLDMVFRLLGNAVLLPEVLADGALLGYKVRLPSRLGIGWKDVAEAVRIDLEAGQAGRGLVGNRYAGELLLLAFGKAVAERERFYESL